MPQPKRNRPKPSRIISSRRRRSTFLRWRRWYKEIHATITDLAHKRRIYREVTAMITANPRLQVPSVFYDWMRRAYITDMTIGVRTLVDWDRRAISLVKLMEEIVDHPKVLSRRRYTAKYRGHLRRFGHLEFDRLAGRGEQQIDATIIRRQRRELINSQKKLRTFVNRNVAHKSRYKMRRLPTYAEMDVCVDLLEDLAKKFTLLLEQKGLTDVVPVIQYDWKAPFRVPWI